MQNDQRQLPFMGSLNLEVLQASQTSLHGDLYFDLMVRESGSQASEPFMIRVAKGACVLSPTPGVMVKAQFLSGQVERLTPA